MQHFENIDKVAFKDLTPEQMACIVKAKAEGKCDWYSTSGGGWRQSSDNVMLKIDEIYRTKPVPAKKLNIPWAVLDKKWVCATYDSFGVYLWANKPELSAGNWYHLNEAYIPVDGLLVIDTEGVEYATSLTERPEGE